MLTQRNFPSRRTYACCWRRFGVEGSRVLATLACPGAVRGLKPDYCWERHQSSVAAPGLKLAPGGLFLRLPPFIQRGAVEAPIGADLKARNLALADEPIHGG